MPQDQEKREEIARMKLIPIPEVIKGQKILFCEDSIVRGTQLKDTLQRVWDLGATEVHMRPACPPLTYSCGFLNFSRSKSEMALAARRAIERIERRTDFDVIPYLDEDSPEYGKMVEEISRELKLTSLKYQRLDDMAKAIGLSKEKLCLGCWRL